VVAEEHRREAVLAALQANGAYLCNEQETAALDKTLFTPDLRVNADCVGQPPLLIDRRRPWSRLVTTWLLLGAPTSSRDGSTPPAGRRRS
jgi:hypothetical protein